MNESGVNFVGVKTGETQFTDNYSLVAVKERVGVGIPIHIINKEKLTEGLEEPSKPVKKHQVWIVKTGAWLIERFDKWLDKI
jgi:hypothetical protein